jgi:excisionase family DNA binding protein
VIGLDDWQPGTVNGHDTRLRGNKDMSPHQFRPPDSPQTRTSTSGHPETSQPGLGLAAERLAYSVNEVSRLPRLSRDLLYDGMRRGNLSYVKIGRGRVIPHEHLHEFLGLGSKS